MHLCLWLESQFVTIPSFVPLFPPPVSGCWRRFLTVEGSKKKPKKTKGSKKEKSKKPKGRSDEEAFGNTDEIFGDLPAAAKTKSPKAKKKKKVEQRRQLLQQLPQREQLKRVGPGADPEIEEGGAYI